MDAITLYGVKTHNLKNFNLTLLHNKFYVITGVSGSGKSSLAFDTLYAEGQRRYVESLSAYARQFLERMEKPDVDSVSGIRPSIAIEAKNVVTNARSTVGTQTEINDYLRVFFARIGQTFCPKCNKAVGVSDPDSVAATLLHDFQDRQVWILFCVPFGSKGSVYWKEFLDEIERQGFTDFLWEGQLTSKEELLKKKKQVKELWVVADKINVNLKSSKRLVESLELAFRYGKGSIRIKAENQEFTFSEDFCCVSCGMNFRKPAPNLFSFNSPLGACPKCQGFGRVITIDWDLVVPDVKKTLEEGAIAPWGKPSTSWEFKQLLKFCRKRKISVSQPWRELSAEHRELILRGAEGISQDEYFSVKDFFDYLEKKTYKMHIRILLSKYRNFVSCSDCHETRLRPEALYVQIDGKTVFDFQQMSLTNLHRFFEQFKLSEEAMSRVEPVYLEICKRLTFLKGVGLGYLSLSRLSRTLSGGEVERIHLATSLGSALVDTLYVLDEPSIGLHERDNQLLIRLLKKLRDLGNTVVVVEHDRTMIESADEVIDMGPQGGERGGNVVFQGQLEGLKQVQESLTGNYLSGKLKIERAARTEDRLQPVPKLWIKVKQAAENNLKSIDVNIPLGKWVVISGVSGSGKSTLAYQVLYHHYLRHRGLPVQDLGKAKSVAGFEAIDDMILIDQSPIGRSSRSNPVTYLKAYDDIRNLFSRLPESKRRGLSPGHFSFNVDGGRCPSCEGEGRIKVEMHFLADVSVPCEACQGKRFKPEILEIHYQGKNVDDVLGMTIDDACQFFHTESKLIQKLSILRQVGLGYLRLGQSSTTLSGGEAQRLKLAAEMTERSSKHILYLFDEPTTGLHYQDIHYLIQAFDQLLARGHSLVIIEHHMELIRLADYVIDLGPEGGDEGGQMVYAGDVQGLIACPASYTGQYLKQYLERN
ncbi:MAG: excinuclease ABC subunit A [Candidatus Omnitrophica bacterium]|nr:excinuclease ABC subunit A [Candidatus Omnitrophota bacterium]